MISKEAEEVFMNQGMTAEEAKETRKELIEELDDIFNSENFDLSDVEEIMLGYGLEMDYFSL